MEKLIRSTQTGHYFANGAWTSDQLKASRFTYVDQVIDVCLTHRLRSVEVVFLSPSGFLHHPIPLPDF